MGSKTLSMPEDALVNMLKTLPEDVLIDVFWKTIVSSDTSSLSNDEKEDIVTARKEFNKGETVKIDPRGDIYK